MHQGTDLSDQATYVVGVDFGVSERFTFVIDILGNYLLDAPRLVKTEFQARDFNSGMRTSGVTFPTVRFENESYNVLSAAVGFKLNVVESLLIDMNILFNLDDNGLRDKITPLIGFEYAF